MPSGMIRLDVFQVEDNRELVTLYNSCQFAGVTLVDMSTGV